MTATRMDPYFAVFNSHVNDAQAQAKRIFISNFGQAKWDEVIQPLEDAGIMSIFVGAVTFYTTFYVTVITLIVNGDVEVPSGQSE